MRCALAVQAKKQLAFSKILGMPSVLQDASYARRCLVVSPSYEKLGAVAAIHGRRNVELARVLLGEVSVRGRLVALVLSFRSLFVVSRRRRAGGAGASPPRRPRRGKAPSTCAGVARGAFPPRYASTGFFCIVASARRGWSVSPFLEGSARVTHNIRSTRGLLAH